MDRKKKNFLINRFLSLAFDLFNLHDVMEFIHWSSSTFSLLLSVFFQFLEKKMLNTNDDDDDDGAGQQTNFFKVKIFFSLFFRCCSLIEKAAAELEENKKIIIIKYVCVWPFSIKSMALSILSIQKIYSKTLKKWMNSITSVLILTILLINIIIMLPFCFFSLLFMWWCYLG